MDRKMSGALAIIGLGGAANGLEEAGIGPTDLHQQIMRSPKRHQTAFDSLLTMLQASRGAQTLRCDSAYCCKRILDSMMHLVENRFL